MRAFDNPDGAAALSEGWRVHYNLVRDHTALGKTPGEAAGLPPIDGFRWEQIIRAATKPPEPGPRITLVATSPGSPSAGGAKPPAGCHD